MALLSIVVDEPPIPQDVGGFMLITNISFGGELLPDAGKNKE